MLKKRLLSLLCVITLLTGLLTGCPSAPTEPQTTTPAVEETNSAPVSAGEQILSFDFPNITFDDNPVGYVRGTKTAFVSGLTFTFTDMSEDEVTGLIHNALIIFDAAERKYGMTRWIFIRQANSDNVKERRR